MTIDQLLSLLEDAKAELGGDAPVRIAHQPSWPFEYSIAPNVAFFKPGQDEIDELREILMSGDYAPDEKDELREQLDALLEEQEETDGIFYLSEGSQIGYLPGAVAREIGW